MGKSSDAETQPLLQRGKQDEYGTQEDSDLYYCGVLRTELFNTDPHTGLTDEEARARLASFGPNELAEKEDNKWVKLMLEFVQPMPLMIWAAMMLEVVESLVTDPVYWLDVAVLLVLQLLNVLIGFYEELQAGNAIASLKMSLKPEAFVKRGGVHMSISAGALVPGDIVVLGAGGAVPADCSLLKGKPLQVDQAALTGESLPVTMRVGDACLMGSTVTRGECEALVTGTGSETFFGKTATLINNVDEMAHFEKIFQSINVTLTTLGCVIISITFTILLIRGADLLEALSFCVVLLISSIPIAMRVVCTTTMALGCRLLADEKAIVARLSAVEEMAGMNILCSDKTGTLTMNQMELQEDLPIFSDGTTREDVLLAAALAAKWKEPPKDALDTLVLNSLDLAPLDRFTQTDFVPFDPSVKRTEATILGPDGETFKVTKGAPHVLLELSEDRDKIRDKVETMVLSLAKRGIRSLAVARTSSTSVFGGDKWTLLGVLTFLDPPRPDTKITIKRCAEFGVITKMITGDHKAIAVEMCRRLEMGTNVLGSEKMPVKTPQELCSDMNLGRDYGPTILNSDGFAQVFPEHKYLIVEALRQSGFIVGMTGDGVNDAPALKRADVGIAVSGATDAARASADIVLTEPGLSTIATAIITSRKIFTRMKNFVIYRVACTVQLLMFFFIACIFIDPSKYDYTVDGDWPAYFSIPVLALVSITILNDGTLIAVAYDNVLASKQPEKWELNNLYIVSTAIGSIAVASSLWLLILGLNSDDEDGILRQCGLDELSYPEIVTMMYLKISLSDYLTLFNARTKGYCWASRPSNVLMGAALFATVCSTLLSAVWPDTEDMKGITGGVILFVWIYTFLWSFVQDFGKIVCYFLMEKFGLIKTTEVITEKDLEGLHITSPRIL